MRHRREENRRRVAFAQHLSSRRTAIAAMSQNLWNAL
jgi:hypothetical protein